MIIEDFVLQELIVYVDGIFFFKILVSCSRIMLSMCCMFFISFIMPRRLDMG